MTTKLTREQGLELLKKYNKEPFHILHGLTVEGTMRWFANELGYGEDADFWAMAGLLHDIDFEMYYKQGIRGIISDIDNTLVPHGAPALYQGARAVKRSRSRRRADPRHLQPWLRHCL